MRASIAGLIDTCRRLQADNMKHHLERKAKLGKSKPRLEPGEDGEREHHPAAWSALCWFVASCTAYLEEMSDAQRSTGWRSGTGTRYMQIICHELWYQTVANGGVYKEGQTSMGHYAASGRLEAQCGLHRGDALVRRDAADCEGFEEGFTGLVKHFANSLQTVLNVSLRKLCTYAWDFNLNTNPSWFCAVHGLTLGSIATPVISDFGFPKAVHLHWESPLICAGQHAAELMRGIRKR
ncbi:hypothetical protein B0H14DRAFT_2647837 [Mycena olivaceomarginata]|nr:hypothetical protein B0H14DRAFT_2647837 [Mycena olivaceomarginata]